MANKLKILNHKKHVVNSDTGLIKIRGARVHNLKNIDLDIPRHKLIVFTGISGSGKSSLAFDTIYAEGQRRYVESLSAYARQFLGLMDKPDVERIEGLSPAISIDQKSASHNPRSTVGTVTEIYDYLRLLFARIGVPHCPICNKKISAQTVSSMVEQIADYPEGTKLMILAPFIMDRKGEHKGVLDDVKKAGYARIRLDGTVMDIDEALSLNLDKKKKHTIEVVVDRLTIEKGERSRLSDSLETALDLGNETAILHLVDQGRDFPLSQKFACPDGHMSMPELNPRNFSFNSPHGACPECTGLGTRLEVDPELVIPNKRLSLAEGAIRPWSKTTARLSWYDRILEAVGEAFGFSTDVPVKDLPQKYIDLILSGTKDKPINIDGSLTNFEGVIANLMRRYRETDSDYMRSEIEQYMRLTTCPVCKGKRLRPEILAVLVDQKSIMDVAEMTVQNLLFFFSHLDKKLSEKDRKIANLILREILARLLFLQNVGLEYLDLNRSAATLSGGEAQRIRLATQIGSGLTGVLYILD